MTELDYRCVACLSGWLAGRLAGCRGVGDDDVFGGWPGGGGLAPRIPSRCSSSGVEYSTSAAAVACDV